MRDTAGGRLDGGVGRFGERRGSTGDVLAVGATGSEEGGWRPSDYWGSRSS